MAKQWATRVILTFQTICWCIAILLLLARGVHNVQTSRQVELQSNVITNTTATMIVPAGQRYAMGVGMIVVAVFMLVVSPVILVARVYDQHRYRSVETFPDLGLPPRYEDVVSRAPSYTSLFNHDQDLQSIQPLPQINAASSQSLESNVVK